MTPPNDDQETWVHQKLRALPDRRAPKNLIPAVLQKIQAGQRAVWWRRPWLEWPLSLRIASAALFGTALAASYWWQDSFILFIRQSAASGLAHSNLLKAAWTIGTTLLAIAQYLVASVKTPFLVVAGMVALALYLAVVAVGALFCRVASEPIMSEQ
jgi:hypothetical protein